MLGLGRNDKIRSISVIHEMEEIMNARMIFATFWLGLVSLLSYLPGVPRGHYILAGNALIAVAIFAWGMAGKGYFRKAGVPRDL